MTPRDWYAFMCRYHNAGDTFKARAFADALLSDDPRVIGVMARCREDDKLKWRAQAMTVLRETETPQLGAVG